MKNVFLILILSIVIVFTSCNSGSIKEAENLNGTHKVKVLEVQQTKAYTYLNVAENDSEQWIAVPKMEAKVGDIYYYDNPLEMNNFESKDLGRTFKTIYFLQKLRTDPKPDAAASAQGMPADHMSMDHHKGKPTIAKEEVKVEPAKGGITIAELFTNKDKYKEQKVKIKGKVVKINTQIMGKNWFHLQDGTNANGDFDLTVTSVEGNVKVNDVVTFEGKVAVDKDFGYGYSYSVLLEDAVLVK